MVAEFWSFPTTEYTTCLARSIGTSGVENWHQISEFSSPTFFFFFHLFLVVEWRLLHCSEGAGRGGLRRRRTERGGGRKREKVGEEEEEEEG